MKNKIKVATILWNKRDSITTIKIHTLLEGLEQVDCYRDILDEFDELYRKSLDFLPIYYNKMQKLIQNEKKY